MSAYGAPPVADKRSQGAQRDNANARKHGLNSHAVARAEEMARLDGAVLTPPVLPDKRDWATYFNVGTKAIEMASTRLGEALAKREGLRWPGLRALTKPAESRLFTLEFLIRILKAGRQYGYGVGQWGDPAAFSVAEQVERLQRRATNLERVVVEDLADAAAGAS